MLRRLLPILHVLGMIILVFGLSMLAPLLLAEITQDGAENAYEPAALITVSAGLLLWLLGHHWRRELKTRDGILLVVLTWSVLPAFATLPLLLHMPDLSVADAYFEAMSGLTATGATVLSGLDHLPNSINLWRAQLHWIGGLGVIVLVAAVLPLLGVGGRQMLKSEMPTPMKDNKLTPRMAETAKGLWVVYILLTLACIGVLWALGMSFFDAVVHAFSVMGLGGFSSHDASLGYFDSVAIEVAVGLFALIAGINFATHFAALRGRTLLSYRHDPEIRWFLGFVLISGFVLALLLWQRDIYLDFSEALRYALFNTISVATTLGFATTDYGQWPFFAGLWMMFLCSFSTSAGSTGGGIKMIRAMILYKQVYRELLHAMHPSAIWPVRIRGAIISQNVLTGVMAFGFVYTVSFVSLSLLMAASGLDIVTAFSAVAATLNNTGPGLNLVGPATTFAVLNDFQTWICTFAMLLGRLEIFTLLVVLMPAFWKK